MSQILIALSTWLHTLATTRFRTYSRLMAVSGVLVLLPTAFAQIK